MKVPFRGLQSLVIHCKIQMSPGQMLPGQISPGQMLQGQIILYYTLLGQKISILAHLKVPSRDLQTLNLT